MLWHVSSISCPLLSLVFRVFLIFGSITGWNEGSLFLSSFDVHLTSHSGEKKPGRLTSSFLFSHLFSVHCHANNLLSVGHLWNGHSAGAFNIRESSSAHDPAHNESLNYDIRIWTVDKHAPLDTGERKSQITRSALMGFLNIICNSFWFYDCKNEITFTEHRWC